MKDTELSCRRIRKAAKEDDIAYTKHAIQRMGERYIHETKVLETIQLGEVIEEQNHGRDTKFLFQEFSDEIAEVYVVVANAPNKPVIITVCRTKEEMWEDIEGLLKRRK